MPKKKLALKKETIKSHAPAPLNEEELANAAGGTITLIVAATRVAASAAARATARTAVRASARVSAKTAKGDGGNDPFYHDEQGHLRANWQFIK